MVMSCACLRLKHPPSSYYHCCATDLGTVRKTFNVFSYDTAWPENRLITFPTTSGYATCYVTVAAGLKKDLNTWGGVIDQIRFKDNDVYTYSVDQLYCCWNLTDSKLMEKSQRLVYVKPFPVSLAGRKNTFSISF